MDGRVGNLPSCVGFLGLSALAMESAVLSFDLLMLVLVECSFGSFVKAIILFLPPISPGLIS